MSRFASLLALSILGTPMPAVEVVLNAGRHPTPHFVARAAPDGKTVVTLGADRCVRIWDAATGKPLRELWLPEHAGEMQGGAYTHGERLWLSPDGKLLALPFYTAVEPRGKLALLPLDGPDVGTFRVIGANVFQVDHVAFSPDGKRVATTCKWPPVSVWEVATGKKVCDIEHDKDLRASGLAFTPDGTQLTVSLPMVNFNERKRSTVATYNGATGKLTSEFKRADAGGDLGRPMWSPDGKTLALQRNAIELRTPHGAIQRMIGEERVVGLTPGWPEAAGFDAKGRLLTAWRDREEFVLRDEIAGKVLARLKPATGHRARVAFTASGLALAVEEYQFTLFDLNGNAAVKTTSVRAANAVPTGLAWAKGPTLAWGFEPNKDGPLAAALNFADMKAMNPVTKDFTRRRLEWDGVKLTDDGYRATASASGKAVRLAYEPELDSDDIKTSTLVGPGHAVLATGSGTFSYDTKTGQQIARHGPPLWVLVPSADGKFFATASGWTPLIRVYRPTRSEPVLTLHAVGREWVAWTRDDVWASSPAAEKWAGTLTRPAAGKLPTFLPLEPMNRSPDKVKAVLK